MPPLKLPFHEMQSKMAYTKNQNVETQPYKDSDTVKHKPLFFIPSAIAVASLLTALATLVLAVAIMTARSEASTGMATIAPSCCK